MKRQFHLLLSGLGLAFSFTAHGQSTFQNLGFEAAHDLPHLELPTQTAYVGASNALPGWTIYLGTNLYPGVWYNGVSAGSALVTLITKLNPYYSNSVIGGNFTAVISAGVDMDVFNHPGLLLPAAIAQSSLIPASAQSLRFRVGSYSLVNDLLVSFNGQTIPFVPLALGPNYTTYGGDVSALAGAGGELRFTQQPMGHQFSTVYLDDIQFSTESIPEPRVYAFLSLLAIICWIMRRKSRPRGNQSRLNRPCQG